MTTFNTTEKVYTKMTPALAAIISELKHYPILTDEEEVTLFTEYRTATEERKEQIKQRICEGTMRFILSVAKKYSADGDVVAELVSVGTFGVYTAIDRFDLSVGTKFISTAVHWMRSEISEYMRKNGAIIRRSNNSLVGKKDDRIVEKFLQQEMREPTEDELIDALEDEYGIKVSYRGDVVKLSVASLDASIDCDSEATVSEIGDIAMSTASRNGYEDEMESNDLRFKVMSALQGLSFREQQMIIMYFGIGCEEADYDKIGERFDCTGERVRQLIKKALPKIKQKLEVAMAM